MNPNNIDYLNNFDPLNINYNNWNEIYMLVGNLLQNINLNNININNIKQEFDLIIQVDLFNNNDIFGMHNFMNTSIINWNNIPDNIKLLMLNIYLNIALNLL